MLRVARSTISQRIGHLRALGVELEAVPGRGYRWVTPVELLEDASIRAELDARVAPLLAQMEVLGEADSTNRYLIDAAQAGAPSGSACFAELQTAGRGRRGRPWISPLGNVYLSVLWHLDPARISLHGLSLAMGVAVAKAVASLGTEGIGLKWPNDVFWRDRKLAGILIESLTAASGSWQVVVGIGMNVQMPLAPSAQIDQNWVDLATAIGCLPGRNRVAARLLGGVLAGFERFAREGFAAFQADWNRWDVTRGRRVVLHESNGRIEGLAQGVDRTGALLLAVQGKVLTVRAGDVSLRMAG